MTIPAPATTTVYVWIQDVLGNVPTGAMFAVYGGLSNYDTSVGINYSVAKASFNASGFAALTIVESQTPGTTYNFSISYPIGKTVRQIDFEPCIVPKLGAVNLATFATVKGNTA